MNLLLRVALAVTPILLTACASIPPVDARLFSLDTRKLPRPDRAVDIAGLGPCTDSPDRQLHVNSEEPIIVLVHGWRGSAGSLRGLAQRLISNGHQTACFSYNDRDSLMRSSAKLAASLEQLAAGMMNRDITVIGHSQGALVARKAMIQERPDGLRGDDISLRLVTISGPFNGIAAAARCTSPIARILTLGLSGPLCQLIAGDKWPEITFRSAFIRSPGTLHASVREHLKIDTDEKGSCRVFREQSCRESDFVFTLAEQRNRLIDDDRRTRVLTVEAGHVEIVGTAHAAPSKLLAVLHASQLLAPAARRVSSPPAKLIATMQAGSSNRGADAASSGH